MRVTKVPAPRGTLIFTAYFLKKYFKKRVMLNKSDSVADGEKEYFRMPNRFGNAS